jgi:hypothetical protein|tara:strand:+ start:35 stop:289 length:255 start_codon:yes stop_codon:yes gene_type:complete
MVKEIKLPKWFNGQVYDEGATVTNRFGGDSCYLNAEELSMYDFIIGASTLMEMGMYAPKNITDMRKGLDWFRKNNVEAYMILLD